jgi:hypothetical protein
MKEGKKREENKFFHLRQNRFHERFIRRQLTRK